MTYAIDEIEGIGDSYKTQLAGVSIATTDQLLGKCSTPIGRDAVSKETGISSKLILRWVNHADLMRIKGVGPQFAELLEASGVDTVKELRHRNADNLASKMAEVNNEKNLAKVAPASSIVDGWIEAAKAMDPAVSY